MIVIFATIHWDNRIRNWSNDFFFMNYHVNIVHKKFIVKTIDIKSIFNKVWYFVGLLPLNIISLLVFLLKKNQDENNKNASPRNIK